MPYVLILVYIKFMHTLNPSQFKRESAIFDILFGIDFRYY